MTGGEFKMFMDFLRSLSIFGDKAPQERVQELIEIISGQADLDAQFNVSVFFILECCRNFWFRIVLAVKKHHTGVVGTWLVVY